MDRTTRRVLAQYKRCRALLQQIKNFSVMTSGLVLSLAICLCSNQIAIAVPTGPEIGGAMFEKCFSDGEKGEAGQMCCYELTQTCLRNCQNQYGGADVSTCEQNCRTAGELCADAFEERPTGGKPAVVEALKLISEEKKPSRPEKRVGVPMLKQKTSER